MKFVCKNLTGQRFGKLVAIERIGTRNTFALWKCKCDCGNEAEVTSGNLLRGHTQSCGCLRLQLVSERFTTHGMTETKIYGVWSNMKTRCENKNSEPFCDYGGRGITFCDEWLEFLPFYNWAMKNGYSENLTIDRKNNDKGYCPENCRWTTSKVQNNNRRDNVFYEFNSQRKTISQWSDICGISYRTIYARLRDLGWNIEKSLLTPVEKHRKYIKEVVE